MATFWATFANVENRARSGGTLPVMRGGTGALGLEPLTTSSSSQNVQNGAGDWTASRDGNITIQSSAAVWLAIAASPTAVAGVAGSINGVHFYLAANERLELTVETSDKLAVIDA